ncbi:hypothetical protein EMIHUDRAFT_248385 [Emiliania huxleyi CCMP1516]|uniref:Uncharacterized protein n=2 Tax=Emiliania huxleyi TaxID=2903 RepID=A0A0D3IGJ3_EMIH1|nr:hypothetical protein EMIHUDRAFT_248385 [Emiliania huxleyi CCMP1516]EOD10378.1 hypothetical protein EMIHUDRAFT_248385 [Emiliania huxleyi CCMP1516]|eukprot:XP_005762807.1 hypothetical protein EMIHUDRAFT_248385 [Emiliania huxleyi CCMP1516]
MYTHPASGGGSSSELNGSQPTPPPGRWSSRSSRISALALTQHLSDERQFIMSEMAHLVGWSGPLEETQARKLRSLDDMVTAYYSRRAASANASPGRQRDSSPTPLPHDAPSPGPEGNPASTDEKGGLQRVPSAARAVNELDDHTVFQMIVEIMDERDVVRNRSSSSSHHGDADSMGGPPGMVTDESWDASPSEEETGVPYCMPPRPPMPPPAPAPPVSVEALQPGGEGVIRSRPLAVEKMGGPVPVPVPKQRERLLHQHQRIMQQRRMAEAAARALVPASENEMFTEPPMLTPPPNGTGRQRYKCKRCGAPKKGHKCTAVEFDFQTGQPLLPKKDWSREEDELIVREVVSNGGRWRNIAKQLSGRTDDAVRNRWNRLNSLMGGETPKAKPARSSSSKAKAVVRSVKRVKHESKSGLLRT